MKVNPHLKSGIPDLYEFYETTFSNIQDGIVLIDKEGSLIKPFRLKKKNILELMSSEQAKAAEKYAKDNRLSFKDDADVNLILTQGFSN